MPDISQKQNKSFTQKIQSGTATTFHKRKRNRGKKNQSPAQQAPKKYLAPVKEYTSKCCNAPAKKPRTGTSTGVRSEGSGKKVTTDPTQVRGLGGWRCEGCKKTCKVTARKPSQEETVVQ